MRLVRLAAALSLLTSLPLAAQPSHDPAVRQAAQREAKARLAMLDGTWRGPAWVVTPAGRFEMVQTERVGPFLGGTIRMIEGRGYMPDGTIGFNALGIVSFDPATGAYRMQTFAQGYSGNYPLTPTDDGFVWEIPAGPGATIRYTATVRDGVWHEIGERIVGEQPPQRIAELTLRRVGDSDWPAAGAVPMRGERD